MILTNFLEWYDRLDDALRKRYGVDTTDVGLSRKEVIEIYNSSQTPDEFAEWYGSKYNLTPLERPMSRTVVYTSDAAPAKITSAPLKYHGGKSYLADWIISLMPPHLTYCEPFFGAGAVLLAKNPEGVSEIINDIDERLMLFWEVLRCPVLFPAFARYVNCVAFGEQVWASAKMFRGTAMAFVNNIDDIVKLTAAYFVTCRQSMAGKGKSFAPLTTARVRRGMNEQVSAWLSAIDGLPAVHARLRRVMAFSEDFETTIERADSKQTLYYCDPTYMHETRTSTDDYEHEMSDAAHERLLMSLAKIKGKFILSGYDNPLYRKWAKQEGWKTRQFTTPNHSAKGKTKRTMIETVWMNYDPPKATKKKGSKS